LTQPAPREIGSAEVQAALAEVLARPAFQAPEPGPLARLLAWIGDRILFLLAPLFQRFQLAELGASWFPWLIRGALALAAVLLVVHIVRALARTDPAAAHRTRGASAPDALATERDWASEADRAAASGHFHEAVLALYQALLLRLGERRLIRLDPAKTPGDYRRELRSHPAAAGALDRFLALFEPAAYGGRQPDRDSFERIRERAREAADG
jgi:hypothetical protein